MLTLDWNFIDIDDHPNPVPTHHTDISKVMSMSSTILSSFNPTMISNHDNLRDKVVKIMGLDAFGYDFTAPLYVPILLFIFFGKVWFSEQPVIP